MNEIKTVVNGNYNEVGDITTLTTTDKTSVVNAINEVNKASNFIVAGITTDQTISTLNTATKLNLNKTIASNGNLLSLDTTNHVIIVGAGVNYIEISAQYYIFAFSNNNLRSININKNNTIVSRNLSYIANNYQTIETSNVAIPVEEGDKISLQVVTTGGNISISHDDNATRIYVKVID